MLEFWFEFGSTYSYPAAMRIERAALDATIQIEYRPFLLGPIFQNQGWSDSPFNIYEAKGAYMWRDMERECEGLALPFSRPSVFPRNGLLAARIACCHQDADWIPIFVREVYRSNFNLDLDISSEDVIGTCLSGCAVDIQKIIEEAASIESKTLLRAQTERAARRGIFGAPTFIVDGEIFWGNDRMETAIE